MHVCISQCSIIFPDFEPQQQLHKPITVAHKKASQLFSIGDKPQLSVTSTVGTELRCGSQTSHSVCRRQPGQTESPHLLRLQTEMPGFFSGQSSPKTLVTQKSAQRVHCTTKPPPAVVFVTSTLHTHKQIRSDSV